MTGALLESGAQNLLGSLIFQASPNSPTKVLRVAADFRSFHLNAARVVINIALGSKPNLDAVNEWESANDAALEFGCGDSSLQGGLLKLALDV